MSACSKDIPESLGPDVLRGRGRREGKANKGMLATKRKQRRYYRTSGEEKKKGKNSSPRKKPKKPGGAAQSSVGARVTQLSQNHGVP